MPVLIVSDFTCDPLLHPLRRLAPGWEFSVAPFNQVMPTLLQAPDTDLAGLVLWTTPVGVLPSFARAARLEQVEHRQVLVEVDEFANLVARAAREHPVLMATWSRSPEITGYGMLDWQPGLGLAHLAAAANLRLAERLAGVPGVHLLDSQRWLGSVADPESPKLWYAAKVPYRPEVFATAALDISAALEALSGLSRKLVIVDLDDTLWGGVVGDLGWERLRLGGPDPLGEAFEDFQMALKELSVRGVQLGVVSKNTEAIAREAIDRHPAMRLRASDFAGMRINWEDKAANVASLVAEIGLGLSAVVFIDDNPVERARVAQALPEVLVPEWPADPMLFAKALRGLRCFASSTLSSEDRSRTQMYATERNRSAALTEIGSRDEWLQSLGTEVHVSPIVDATYPRVTQLLNKTNQLNLRTRRMSEPELRAWSSQPGRSLLTISVGDRYGDLGLVGIIGIEFVDDAGWVTDFVLSCRAMGRGIEETMLHAAWQEAVRFGARALHVRYEPTDRNEPTLRVLRSLGLEERDDLEFMIDGEEQARIPAGVFVVDAREQGTERRSAPR